MFCPGGSSKQTMVALPLVLLLLDYWPLGQIGATPLLISFRLQFRNGLSPPPVAALWWARTNGRGFVCVLEKIPLMMLAIGGGVMAYWAQRPAITPSAELSLPWRIENAVIAYADYLGQFFYPAGLAATYPRCDPHVPLFWKVAGALAVLIGITAGVWFLRRKCPYLLVGWLWYLVMMLPVVGLVQFGVQAVADRFTYLPEIGLGIALAWGLADVTRAVLSGATTGRGFVREVDGRGVAGGAARCTITALTIATLLGLAWRQTSFWSNGETLWTRAVSSTASNKIAHANLAALLDTAVRLAEALDHTRWILRNRPYGCAKRKQPGVHRPSGPGKGSDGTLPAGFESSNPGLPRPTITSATLWPIAASFKRQ